MNELNAFERRLAAGLDAYAGPRRSVDAVAIARTAASRMPLRRSILLRVPAGFAPAPRLAWSTVGLIALLVLALVAGALFVGSQQRRLPAALGPAGNGLVAYDHAGDIFVGDAVTGQTTAIVTGPANDSRPIFSPDGTRIAFLRGKLWTADASIVVVREDGSNERVIVPAGFLRDLGPFAWTPDGASLVVNHDGAVGTSYFDGKLTVFDAAGVAAPRLLTPPLPDVIGAPYFLPSAQVAPIFRPPTGDRILSHRPSILSVMDADGTDVTELVGPSRNEGALETVMDAVWSPDGSKIAFAGGLRASKATGLHYFIYVMSADGNDLRRLSREAVEVESGQLVEERFPAWSPDSSRIVFDRGIYEADRCCSLTFRVTVVDVDTGAQREFGAPEIIIRPHDPYPGESWSPDGRSIVLLERPGARPVVIDVETGDARELPWEATSPPSWQRIAETPG